MLHALGGFVGRRPWVVIAVWAMVAAAGLTAVPRVGTVLTAGGFSASGIEAERAADRLRTDLAAPGPSVLVVFRSDTLTASDPRFLASAARALAPLTSLGFVRRIVPFWESAAQVAPSQRTAYAAVYLDVDDERIHATVPQIRNGLGPTDLETHVAGAAVFYDDIQRYSEGDLRRVEIIGLPFALVALLLVFGSVVAASIPVIAGGASVVAGLGVIWLAGQVGGFSVFALNVVTLVGLGLGADYSLFLVSRFREEMRHHDRATAVIRTLDSAGRAVVFAGLTVLIGLLALTLFEFKMLRSIGIGGSAVVVLAMLAALTLVPAILAVLGPSVDRWRVWRPSVGVRDGWARLARAVMRRPLVVFVAVTAVLVALGAPFLHARVSAPDAAVLPVDSPSRRAYDLLQAEFGAGHVAPLFVVVRLPESALAAASVERLYRFGAALAADPRVAKVTSAVNIDPRITLAQYQVLYRNPQAITEPYAAGFASALTRDRTAVLAVEPRAGATSEEARDLVYAIRAYRDQHGLDALVGGGAAGLTDFVDRLYADFPWAAGVILTTTYAVLVVLFRSLVLPLKAVVMNVLSLCASFGALVLVFQDGWLAGVLGFEPLGYIEATLPVVLFALLFGLSMDYEVFLLTRVKEAYDAGHDNVASVALGLRRSGPVITSAAFVVIVVSLAFVTADIVLIKAVGLGAAIAVFVDASIVRSLLVPAAMCLLGRWNWWAPFGLSRAAGRGRR
ncbi:MAG: MMPL family transporter [Actinobacteria bacterium]|nr:MMPL family transporter [Actinomycetota bacterium]